MNRQELELKIKQELAKLAMLNLEMRELVNKEDTKQSLQQPIRYTRIESNN